MKKSSLISECAKLMSFVKPYWKFMTLAMISMIIYTLASGMQISLIKPIIDKLLKAEAKEITTLPRIDIDQPAHKQSDSSLVKQYKDKIVNKFKFIGKIQKRATGSYTSIGVVMAIIAPIILLSCYYQQYFRNRVM